MLAQRQPIRTCNAVLLQHARSQRSSFWPRAVVGETQDLMQAKAGAGRQEDSHQGLQGGGDISM